MDNYAYQSDESNGKPFAITRCSSVPRPGNDYLVEVNSRSKFLRRSIFNKKLTAVLIVIVIILFIVMIILATLYGTKMYQNRLCTTEECLRSAANLHLSTDFTIDPCDDFYEYICGRWSLEHPNHGWFPSFSAFSTISEKVLIATETFLQEDEKVDEPVPVKQAKVLYTSCMDTDSIDSLGLSVIYKYLENVKLPQIPSIFTKNDSEIEEFKFNFLKADALIKKTFAMDVLVGFSVEPNMLNRSENVMYIGVPTQPCPLPSPLKKNSKNEDVETLKKITNSNVIRYILKLFVVNITKEEPDEDTLKQAVDVLLNMTSQIDELVANYTTLTDEVLFMTVKEYQIRTNKALVSGIQKEYPEVWTKYVTYLFDGTNITIDFATDSFYYGEYDDAYLPKILGYALTTSDIYLELYMWWVTVFAMIINTSSSVVDYIVEQTAPFYTGVTVLRSRSLDCSVLVNTFMGMAVSYGLADRAFSNKTKPKVEQMLYDIKDAFVHQVNSLTWMDKKTKQATLEKSREMISFIGYPDWLFQKGALEVYYEGIVVNNDTFLDNMMNFVKLVIPSRLEDLRKTNERNWSTDPTDVNAYNSFPDNSINLPMAILNFPAYNLGLEVLNYGAIGSILGHELTHGFDNSGRKYDKYGNYKEWWTNTTIQTFEEKIECFIKQYDNFTMEGLTTHVQGKKTLGENLADNGGLSHAYRAYHSYLQKHESEPKLPGFENFTHDQLFFMSFGSIWCQTITLDDLEVDIESDVHSPNKFRVLGTLQNSPEFSKAFKCPKGSKMNPTEKKCKVW